MLTPIDGISQALRAEEIPDDLDSGFRNLRHVGQRKLQNTLQSRTSVYKTESDAFALSMCLRNIYRL